MGWDGTGRVIFTKSKRIVVFTQETQLCLFVWPVQMIEEDGMGWDGKGRDGTGWDETGQVIFTKFKRTVVFTQETFLSYVCLNGLFR